MGSLLRRDSIRGVVAFVAALAIVLAFVLIFASPTSAPRSSGAGAAVKPTPMCTVTVLHQTASYVVAYATLHDLRVASDLIVVGTAGQLSAASAPGDGIQTSLTVSVEKIVFAKPEANAQSGGALQSGSRIVVEQQGGALDCREIINDDDPLMRQGDHVILFLRQFGSGDYGILEPVGHFVIDAQGVVRPANPAFTSTAPQNLTVSQFIARIGAA